MTHPSIQGLREVVYERVAADWNDEMSVFNLVDAALQAQAAYLTEHGVLLSGEGLVRVPEARGGLAHTCPAWDDPTGREWAMVTVREGTSEHHGRDGVWCDPCLVPLVKALNDGGLRTVASCCGHRTRDGSIVVLVEDQEVELVVRPFAPYGEAANAG